MASGYEPLRRSNELATEIVKEVGLLPHAIEQRASYVKFNNLDLQTFLERYRQTPNQVLEWDDGYTHHRSPDALEVLRFYPPLEPEAIPWSDVWNRTNEEAGFSTSIEAESVQPRGRIKTQEVFRDEIARETAIGSLRDLNLVRRVDNNPKLLWMHDLTKLAARAPVSAANTDMLIAQGISVMYHMFPIENTTAIDRAWVDLCLPQCGALINQAKARAIPVSQYAVLLALSGQANVFHDAVVTGVSQLEEAKPIYVERLGLENNRTMLLIHKLAQANKFSSNMKRAEELYRQVLTLRESITFVYQSSRVRPLPHFTSPRQYGRSSSTTRRVQTSRRHGQRVSGNGDLPAANQAYEKAIGRCVGDLENHPVAFRFLDAAGLVKREMGHLKAAGDMSRKGYDRFQAMLGWDDPYTPVAANDYGELLHAQGKYYEDRDMYAKCLVSLGKLVGYAGRWERMTP
ncbi:hypothetical protein EKO27_g9464 [Xylaria grammica]|uniref:Uncharacterized protein n=1 Tax=Xylaria grammica TaxID=363999 RepID=A0A439CTZ3_9PEZI|nr:hypothetical protein EKO27_g9464 [Xylaria grammica]